MKAQRQTQFIIAALELGSIPVGTFALRFWSSVKYSESYNNQGILLDNLTVQGTAEVPGAPFGPVPADGETAALVGAPLAWSNGANTESVDLYFSASTAEVESFAPAARVVSAAPADSLLTWSNGVRTVTVDLYLGTDPAAVESLDPAVMRLAAQAVQAFDPGGLTEGLRYWWRVVARGDDGQRLDQHAARRDAFLQDRDEGT